MNLNVVVAHCVTVTGERINIASGPPLVKEVLGSWRVMGCGPTAWSASAVAGLEQEED